MLAKKGSKGKITPSGSVKHHFQDYCASTSIHGVKYLGEEERPLAERIWWLLVFIICLSGNFFLIGKVWIKWHESPVIVSFAETTTPVWQVPFPAVTLCSETKSRSTLFNFTDAVNRNLTEEIDGEMFNKMSDVSLLCDNHVIVENGSLTTNESTIEFLFEVAPPFEDTVHICKWKGPATQNCSHLFTPIITDEGVCFSFNMLPTVELFRGQGIPYFEDNGYRTEGWTLEGGYPPDAPLDTYPHRALTAGAKAGLIFVMKAMWKDADYYCKGPVQGFRVLLHNPAEVPSVGERYLRAPLRQEIVASIQPKIMTTSKGLRSYSPDRRQCYFPSERYLAHFKVYTQRNCELECLTNYTLKKCGCVGLHMPRSESVKICGGGSKECMLEANDLLRRYEIESSYKETKQETCDCLPACTSIQYDAETSQADFEVENVFRSYNDNLTEIVGSSMARVSVFFKDMQFTTSRRSELFGLVDFLANCGGLLGLFCGVSLLSLVEIIYYVTLRLWGNMKATKKTSSNEADIEAELSKHVNFNSIASSKLVHED
ncbi:pickpocket 26 isoform X2 [Rhodnius prolixus]